MATPISRNDYIDILKQGDKNNLRHILEVAKDVRKFEIELYWKRAAYFWAFVSVFFIGYYQTLPETKFNGNFLQEKLLINCAIIIGGYIFSLGWFFVNKGSKFWQENWEKHIDMLENELGEPLYSIIMHNKNRCFSIKKSYPYSVSKVNQILSFMIVFGWALLIIFRTLYFYPKCDNLPFIGDNLPFIIGIAIIVFIPIVFHYCARGFAAKVTDCDESFFKREQE